MIRSFGVAFITIVVVASFSARAEIAAQQPGAGASGPSNVPIQFTGGTPGVNLELFVNSGKVADVTITATGTAASILDLSNLGKVQLQVYIDVCQDGKTVRVLVVAGQPISEDNCKRRIAGGAWWSDCGVTRITIDLTKFGMRVIGCGSYLTNPKTIIPTAGGLVLIPILLGGGGDSDTPFVSTPITPTTATPPGTTTTANPPVTQPPATQPTNPPPAPFDFSLGQPRTGVDHVSPGNFSDLCGAFNTTPSQVSQPFTVSTTGPGVQQATVTGNTNASGVGTFRVRINAFGQYNWIVTMVVQGLSRTTNGNLNVGSAGVACP
jgi:hypothetical protein